ncbi:MAG: DinB family protein [Actinomycetota bacterium]
MSGPQEGPIIRFMSEIQATDERTLLGESLDLQRDVMLWKIENVGEEALRKPLTHSGMTLLGIVKHLLNVEIWWYSHIFEGTEVTFPWSDDDPDGDWRIEADETTEKIVAGYKDAIASSRAIVARHDLDELSVIERRGRHPSLRWIMLHMIEETARHAGHADVLREMIDGTRGYTRDIPM